MIEIFSRSNPFLGPVRAVILDWGGTAVDFGSFGNLQPVLEAFRQSWVEVSPEDVRKHMGLALWDQLASMLEDETVLARWDDIYGALPTEIELERIYRAAESFSASSAAMYAEPVPGLLETVSELRGRGIRIGSNTSRGFQAMEAMAEAARERGYEPDAMVCSTDVPAGRPFPWMCYQNAISLEAFPLEAVVKVGDTVPDILEGLNAGMWTVGVTKTGSGLGMSPEEVEQADPAEIAERLSLLEQDFLDAGAHFVIEGVWDCPAVIDEVDRMLAQGERP